MINKRRRGHIFTLTKKGLVQVEGFRLLLCRNVGTHYIAPLPHWCVVTVVANHVRMRTDHSSLSCAKVGDSLLTVSGIDVQSLVFVAFLFISHRQEDVMLLIKGRLRST